MDPITLSLVTTIVTTTVPLLIGWGMTMLKKYVASKTQNEAVLVAMTQFDDLVTTTVKDLEQRVVPFYKDAMKNDGKLDDVEKKAIKKMAIANILNQLPDATQTILTGAMNNFDEYLSSKIESAVHDLK